MPDSAPIERPLGPQEALFAELIRRANGAIQMTCIAELAEPAPAATVLRGLKALHHRHPMLRARIVERDQLSWCCDVPWTDIPVRRESMGPDFDISLFYADEVDAVLDLGRRSWRVVLVSDAADRVTWLALTVNHAAIDGRSALVVLNDLDRFLDDESVFPLESLPLLPPVEQALAGAIPDGDQSFELSVPPDSMWTVSEPAPSSARRPHGFLRTFPAEAMERLHDRLHAGGIHLAAAFCAAAVRAGRAFPGHTGWTQILAPTDIRRDCRPPIPDDAVGEFVSVIPLTIEPAQQDADMAALADVLNTQLSDRRPLALRLAPEYRLADTRAQTDDIAAAHDVFSGGLCVTDVGDLQRLSGRPTGFSRVMLMPAQKHGIHPIMVAVVTAAAGACLTFGYAEPLTARETAEAYADRYLAALMELTDGR